MLYFYFIPKKLKKRNSLKMFFDLMVLGLCQISNISWDELNNIIYQNALFKLICIKFVS